MLLRRKKPTSKRHLRDVDVGTLGAGDDHGLEVVVLGQRLFGRASGFVASVVEDAIDLVEMVSMDVSFF